MHHKFSLVDDELLLAGSCNYTTAAVLWNYECIEISRCARRVRCSNARMLINARS